jgi:hypothetical protein
VWTVTLTSAMYLGRLPEFKDQASAEACRDVADSMAGA